MQSFGEVCQASLAYSLSKQELRHYAGLIAALAGCYGWGYAAEAWLQRATAGRLSVAHAFLQGTVVTVILMLAGTLLGICQPGYGVAAAGVVAGVAAFTYRRKLGAQTAPAVTSPLRRRLPAPGDGLLLLAFGPLVLFFGVLMVIYPTYFGDTTAIWAFHGKALTCECLFDSRFVKEAVFSGTHPEYPLFMPLMHAYVFTLMDSFRDDLVKIHQGLAFICVCWVMGYSFAVKQRSRLAAALALILFIALCNAAGGGLIEVVRTEINAALFAVLVSLALLDKDLDRLWLYGFGLAFVKRESFVGVWILLGLLILFALFGRPRALPMRLRLQRARPYLLPFTVLLPTLVLLLRLPSRHEQYERVLLEGSIWREGLKSARIILEGCWGTALRSPTWKPYVVLLPVVAVVALVGYLRRPTHKIRVICCLVLWTLLMLVMLFAVYVVSPWGAKLYTITFERELEQFLPPFIVALAASVAVLMQAKRRTVVGRCLGLALAGLTVFLCYKSFFLEIRTRYNALLDNIERHRIGIVNFANANPDWRMAIALDSQLPPGARGALVNDRDYYLVNYLLYPRVFYPTDPNIIAGTSATWQEWRDVSPETMAKYGLVFKVHAWQLVDLLPH